MGLDNKQRQKSCPLCHWLVAADARAADCQGWLILISMKGIGEMYYQEPGPWTLDSNIFQVGCC